jgi:hypothetical protein
MFSEEKLQFILDNLVYCPRTAETLPCSIEHFKKVIPMIEDPVLDKLYEAVVLESKLQSDGN